MFGLIFVNIHKKKNILLRIITQEIFLPLFMLCEYPQEYHFTSRNETYMEFDRYDEFIHRHTSSFEII